MVDIVEGKGGGVIEWGPWDDSTDVLRAVGLYFDDLGEWRVRCRRGRKESRQEAEGKPKDWMTEECEFGRAVLNVAVLSLP